MATSAKSYNWRECLDCKKVERVRTDNRAERCLSCSKKQDKNPNFGDVKFTGTVTEYKRYHARVYRKRGRAYRCINGCHATRYHWANISGRFEDPDDYQMMCPTCHSKMDRRGE